MASTTPSQPLRIGILGAGSVTQTVHLPTLHLLQSRYTVLSICDVSPSLAAHSAGIYRIPQCTTRPDDLFANPDIDLILNCTSDEYHESYTIAALKAGKHVMLEKPATLSLPSAKRMLEAERGSGGKRVFVGYMRRQARSFTAAFKREVAGIDRILYARVRDIIGHNDYFISQSGTFPIPMPSDIPVELGAERERLLETLYQEAFPGQEVTEEMKTFCRFLGGLASHDISLMREALGFPESVAGVSANYPFYSAIFNYRNKTGEPFAVTYESGLDTVPRFDAHLAVYGKKKTVNIKYDTPFVKGLPIKVTVDEENGQGEVETKEIISSYEDAYTTEWLEVYACLVGGKKIKTSLEDAMEDLRLYDMMYRRWNEGKGP